MSVYRSKDEFITYCNNLASRQRNSELELIVVMLKYEDIPKNSAVEFEFRYKTTSPHFEIRFLAAGVTAPFETFDTAEDVYNYIETKSQPYRYGGKRSKKSKRSKSKRRKSA